MAIPLVFKSIVVTLIGIVIAIVLLTIFNIIKGGQIDINSFFYGLLIGGGQSFFPFLVFVMIYNFLIVRLQIKKRYFINVYRQFMLGVALMMAVILVFIVVDQISNRGVDLRLAQKDLYDYLLFIVFVPTMIAINHKMLNVHIKNENKV